MKPTLPEPAATVARFRARLRAGAPCRVVNPDFADAALIETLASLGVDAVMLDCEQGAPHVESVEAMARVARLADLLALVRVSNPAPWEIERALFRGAHGIVVPRVDDPAQARAVVDNVRYLYGTQAGDKLVVVQVESAQALEALDELLAIDGIDCYFVGPVDLARSLGAGNDWRRPDVLAKVEDAVRRIRASGRAVGMLVNLDDAEHWHRLGVSFLYHHALDYLRRGAAHWPLPARASDGAGAGS